MPEPPELIEKAKSLIGKIERKADELQRLPVPPAKAKLLIRGITDDAFYISALLEEAALASSEFIFAAKFSEAWAMNILPKFEGDETQDLKIRWLLEATAQLTSWLWTASESYQDNIRRANPNPDWAQHAVKGSLPILPRPHGGPKRR